MATGDGLLVLDERGTILEADAAAATLVGTDRLRLVGTPLADLVRDAAGRTLSFRTLPGTEPRRVVVSLGEDDSLLHRLPYAVVTLRGDGRVAFANEAARALVGPDAVRVGEPLGGASPRELRSFAQTLADSPAAPAPAEIRLADGRIVRATGLGPTGDDPAVLLLEEIGERHRRELVLGEFLRNAAHQLRTPVAGITAAIELLQAGAKERPADRDQFLGHIERHAERLRRVVHGVLVLARARTGETPPLDPVELRPFLDGVAEEAGRDDVAAVVDCPPGLAALATRELLHEALAAVLDNASAHAGNGGIRITARRAGASVLLSVSDDGPGIAPELLDRVFEPFFQADAASQGYGLGLAIAAQAVETMGGEIDVSSGIGAGTTFTVKLPAATMPR